MRTHVSALCLYRCLWEPDEGIRSSTEVADVCKLTVLGAGKQIQALWRAASTLDHWAISPTLMFILLRSKSLRETYCSSYISASGGRARQISVHLRPACLKASSRLPRTTLMRHYEKNKICPVENSSIPNPDLSQTFYFFFFFFFKKKKNGSPYKNRQNNKICHQADLKGAWFCTWDITHWLFIFHNYSLLFIRHWNSTIGSKVPFIWSNSNPSTWLRLLGSRPQFIGSISVLQTPYSNLSISPTVLTTSQRSDNILYWQGCDRANTLKHGCSWPNKIKIFGKFFFKFAKHILFGKFYLIILIFMTCINLLCVHISATCRVDFRLPPCESLGSHSNHQVGSKHLCLQSHIGGLYLIIFKNNKEGEWDFYRNP